ncbi:MAG: efflux RND transporter permease subunit [Asticcacaulis sp.]
MSDEISRIDGVGDTRIFGSQYAMRIWLNADELASYQLTPNDVINAIKAQNTQVSAGALGADPVAPDTALNATITAQSQLSTVPQFENIIVKNNPAGTPVLLKDVARVELGPQNYGNVARMNGHIASGMQINLATGARPDQGQDQGNRTVLPGRRQIRHPQRRDAVRQDFDRRRGQDSGRKPIALVFVVMFVFLQNWRATLIPAIAVPVVLLGTFGILAVFGYTINTLTMFGLVLAIGLLVDDAIVVVENVERVMHEEGLPPLEATRRSMDEITGALIGVASVLAAMFVPMAFFGGTQGIIYRQFSVTLVSAMALSVVVALVLTPPLCATLLKAPKHSEGAQSSKEGMAGGDDPGCQGARTAVGLQPRLPGVQSTLQMAVKGILKVPSLFLAFYAAIIGAGGRSGHDPADLLPARRRPRAA